MPILSIDDAPAVPGDLIHWLRGFAGIAQAPAGQPNLVADNITKAADFLEAYGGDAMLAAVGVQMQSSVAQANAACVAACNIRRAKCGGGPQAHCATCPRRLGLALAAQPIAG